MYTSIVILVVIASVLMCLIVLIQESKGGGLAADYSNNNQIRSTQDIQLHRESHLGARHLHDCIKRHQRGIPAQYHCVRLRSPSGSHGTGSHQPQQRPRHGSAFGSRGSGRNTCTVSTGSTRRTNREYWPTGNACAYARFLQVRLECVRSILTRLK